MPDVYTLTFSNQNIDTPPTPEEDHQKVQTEISSFLTQGSQSTTSSHTKPLDSAMVKYIYIFVSADFMAISPCDFFLHFRFAVTRTIKNLPLSILIFISVWSITMSQDIRTKDVWQKQPSLLASSRSTNLISAAQ